MRSILSSIVLLLAVVDFTQAAPLEERAPRSFRWSIKSFGGTVDVCLTADGFFNGAPVMVRNCNFIDENVVYNYPVYNQRWNVDSSKGHITTNADLCLDAGDGYYPGAPVKVWQCYDDYDVQMFRIKRPQGGDMIKSVAARHDGVDYCLSVPPGDNKTGQPVRLAVCSADDRDQWFIGFTDV